MLLLVTIAAPVVPTADLISANMSWINRPMASLFNIAS
jgi:hypothetical protein